MLFVSAEFPYPPLSGGCLRTLSLLRCLAPSFEVHCVTFAQAERSEWHRESLYSFAPQVTVLPLERHPRGTFHRYARNIRRALKFVPPLVDRFSEPSLRRSLAPLLASRVDCVWFEHLWLAPYVEMVHPPARRVLDVHNVESDFYRQMRQATWNPVDRLGYYIFEQAARHIEDRYLAAFDFVVAVSETDRTLLAEHCSRQKILVVPNAVELTSAPTQHDSDGQNLYFAGRLDYPPNRTAVRWFYRQVWPRIRRQYPDLRWYIVGACPELLENKMRRDPQIVALGQVEKTEPYLQASSLTIVPVRIGAGTRFKILEAWAAGKAVVSTTKGAQGLLAHHGENIWIANTPEEFSGAVLRLLSDAKLRVYMGRKGWETVQEHYSWVCLEEQLRVVLFSELTR